MNQNFTVTTNRSNKSPGWLNMTSVLFMSLLMLIKEVQIVYRLFLVNCYLLHLPRLPSQTASDAGGWVICPPSFWCSKGNEIWLSESQISLYLLFAHPYFDSFLYHCQGRRRWVGIMAICPLSFWCFKGKKSTCLSVINIQVFTVCPLIFWLLPTPLSGV